MTDNELLEQLFQPIKEMEIADDGFCERVMQQLPHRNIRRLSHLWTIFCIVTGITLFVLLRCWEPIGYALLMFLNTPPTHQQLLLFGVSLGIAGIIVLVDIISREVRRDFSFS